MRGSMFRFLRAGLVVACCSAVVFVALSGVVGVVSASAAEPWWHIQQAPIPTYISKTNESGEVQEIETTLEKSKELEEFGIETPQVAFEVKVNGVSAGFFATEPVASAFGGLPEPTAANIQTALEPVYGAGIVEVTGGPAGTGPILVKTAGPDVGVVVPRIEVVAIFGKATAKVMTPPGPAGEVVLRVADVGDAPIAGETVPVKIADVLPKGLTAIGIAGTVRGWHFGEVEGHKKLKTANEGYGHVSCSLAELSCSYSEDAPAYNWIEVTIPVIVSEPERAPFSGENSVSVGGGGAPSSSRSQPLTVSEGQAPFGIEPDSFEVTAEGEGGSPDAQAGGHPFQFSTSFTFTSGTVEVTKTGERGAGQVAQPRNLRFPLPPGLVGNAQLIPRCPLTEFDKEVKEIEGDACPADTAVGIAFETFGVGNDLNDFEAIPVFNLDPGAGEPARFGFVVSGDPVFLNTSVRSGGDYGVDVDVDNVTQLVAFRSSFVTFWGAPNAPAHNGQRGWECLIGLSDCPQNAELPQQPFLTLPDSCQAPFEGMMEANAWTEPEYVGPIDSTFQETLDGCNEIPFKPSVAVAPDEQSSSSTSGLTVHVRLPQTISEDSTALGEGTIRDTTVALPAGVRLNPSDSGGLEACSEEQVGYLNKQGSNGELEFTGALPAGWEEDASGTFCPKASKIGEVSIQTPLLAKPVKGYVYLATPAPNGEGGQNPFNTLLSMYIVAEDREAGVAVKLPGKVGLCERAGQTIEGIVCGAQGQLVSTFDDTPQLPFEDLELHFFGGERSPLSTPAHCGAYTTQAVFTPWSGGEAVQLDLDV